MLKLGEGAHMCGLRSLRAGRQPDPCAAQRPWGPGGWGEVPGRGTQRTEAVLAAAEVWGVWAPHLCPKGRRLLPRLLGLASPSPKPRSFPPAEVNRGMEGGHPGADVCPGPISNTREAVGWSPQLRKTAEEQSLPGRPPSPLALGCSLRASAGPAARPCGSVFRSLS